MPCSKRVYYYTSSAAGRDLVRRVVEEFMLLNWLPCTRIITRFVVFPVEMKALAPLTSACYWNALIQSHTTTRSPIPLKLFM